MVNFGKSLFPLFALALDVPEDFFENKVWSLSIYILMFWSS